ncbi:MAG TPA: ABC transporter ATP-binding protein [Negativicutes bacterium]|jgi:NitT/TauT family transport system ATP-binding protein/sulfonate transport system ATP-binding protein
MVTKRAAAGEVSVKKVSKIFNQGSKTEMVVLDNVDLNIASGCFISLLGPSGCGKSTLLRLIAGLDTVTYGSIALDKEEIRGPHYLRGLVFQDPTLFPWRTITHNIALGLEARGILAEKQDEISEYIKLVGLEGFENYYPHQVSGGMAQRASLARALINHPKVLLLDEPLGALDAFTRLQMQEEILRIWQDRGTTMVFVTHDVDEAIFLSDKIAVMTPRPGKIQEIVNVPLDRPRDRADPAFIDTRRKIMDIFNSNL